MFVERWINHAKYTHCTWHIYTRTHTRACDDVGGGGVSHGKNTLPIRFNSIPFHFIYVRCAQLLCEWHICHSIYNESYQWYLACRSIGVAFNFGFAVDARISYHWEYLKRDYWPIQEKSVPQPASLPLLWMGDRIYRETPVCVLTLILFSSSVVDCLPYSPHCESQDNGDDGGSGRRLKKWLQTTTVNSNSRKKLQQMKNVCLSLK